MAAVAKSSKASFDPVSGMLNPPITRPAGEAILGAVTPVYLGTDGKVYNALGAAANAAAVLFGWSFGAAAIGEPCDIYQGVGTLAKYADETLTPGQKLFLAAAGGLDTAATTGDAVGIAQAVDPSTIRLTRLI